MCTSDTWERVLTRDETLRKPVNGAPQKHMKVNSLVNETLKKPLNRAPLTRESALTAEGNPDEKYKPCLSET